MSDENINTVQRQNNLPDPFSGSSGIKTNAVNDDQPFQSLKSIEEQEGFLGDGLDKQEEAPVEPEVTESIEAEAEESVEASSEEETDSISTPEEAPEQPRAQKRIVQLAREKNELRSIVEALKSQNEALVESVKEQTRIARDNDNRLKAKREKEQNDANLRDYQQRAEALGFNPNDPYLQLNYDQTMRMQQLEKQLAEQAEFRRGLEVKERETRYISALDAELTSALNSYKIDPEVRDGLFQNALALAAVRQIQNPADAVKMAIQPVVQSLTKKAAPAAKKAVSPEQRRVDELVAVRGATGGRQKGQSAGKPKPKTVEQFEKDFGSRGDW